MADPSYKLTDIGVQVYGVPGIPDGTTIPYDYDPNTDMQSPPEVKAMAIQILQMVAQSNQGAAPVSSATGNVLDKLNYQENDWSWLSRQEPKGYYRKQGYNKKSGKTTKKRAPTKKRKTSKKVTKRPRIKSK